MTARRLYVLITGLPKDSLIAKILNGEITEWSIDTYLLASIRNLILQNNRSQAGKRVHDSEYIKPPTPKTPPPAPMKPQEKAKQKGWKDLDRLFGVRHDDD